jgi:hypothetical protein
VGRGNRADLIESLYPLQSDYSEHDKLLTVSATLSRSVSARPYPFK